VSNIFKSILDSQKPPRVTGGAYTVDGRDTVHALANFPQSSIGAPLPTIIASENSLSVIFYLEQRDPNWDGKTVKLVTPDSNDEPIAVVRFRGSTHYFGPPNDEAFSGHPLAARGLKPYGAFEVFSSSWIRALENMNSVHPRYQPGNYSSRRHFILTFHDSIFECIAKDFSVEQHSGSLRSVLSGLLPSV
jgi:hypothetical protein